MTQKILIIDDDPDLVLATRMPLEAKGYDVQTAGSESAGWDAVAAYHPDLIILDVMMETTTAGFQFAQALHGPDAKPEYRAIPIIMLTAIHQTTPLRFQPEEDYLPVQVLLEKPVEPHRLLAEVEKILGEQ